MAVTWGECCRGGDQRVDEVGGRLEEPAARRMQGREVDRDRDVILERDATHPDGLGCARQSDQLILAFEHDRQPKIHVCQSSWRYSRWKRTLEIRHLPSSPLRYSSQ